jgi:hypothetical protein
MAGMKLHALDVLGHDSDGDRYRHALVVAQSTNGAELCAECRSFATRPHPLAKERPTLYADVELIEQCRGITLCAAPRCRMAHLLRHDRQLLEQETRAIEAKKASRAA